MMTQQLKQEVSSDTEDKTIDTSNSDRTVKSAPGRLNGNLNSSKDSTKSETANQREKDITQVTAPPVPYMRMFPSLPAAGSDIVNVPSVSHLNDQDGREHERQRPTGAVPPSFGQAVHRYYTKDIKRSTSPDPYLYEANLSRIRSFHYQAWLRWMESKKRKATTRPRNCLQPTGSGTPLLSPEMKSPVPQNMVLDMSMATSSESDPRPIQFTAFEDYRNPMIDLTKFPAKKRKRDGSTSPKEKPENLSRHEFDLDRVARGPMGLDTRPCKSRGLDEWTTADVVKFVAGIPVCREYAGLFEDQLITGQSLPLLSLEHLTNKLTMKLGPALTLRATVAALTDQCVQCQHCLHCHSGNRM